MTNAFKSVPVILLSLFLADEILPRPLREVPPYLCPFLRHYSKRSVGDLEDLSTRLCENLSGWQEQSVG